MVLTVTMTNQNINRILIAGQKKYSRKSKNNTKRLIKINDNKKEKSMTINEAAQILGISVNATAKELQSAFRKLVLKWHPDKHPNDKHAEEMMKKINEAHKVFKEYLDKGGNTNTGSQSSTRPGNSAGGASGSYRPGGSTNNAGFADWRQSRLKDSWNKYQTAKAKYDAFTVELRKAFDKKIAEQKKYDELKAIFDISPTTENLKKLSEQMAVFYQADMEHGTAKMTFQTLKLEMDMWKKEYDILLADIENSKNQGRR